MSSTKRQSTLKDARNKELLFFLTFHTFRFHAIVLLESVGGFQCDTFSGYCSTTTIARPTGKISFTARPNNTSVVIADVTKNTFAYSEHVLVRLDEFRCGLLTRNSRKCRFKKTKCK